MLQRYDNWYTSVNVLLKFFYFAESFAYNGTVTIINHEYRETLADNSTKDYKKMAAKVAFEVINKGNVIYIND